MSNPNLESRCGYELIGSWNVNLAIPEEIRQIFRGNIEAYQKGELTDRLVRENYKHFRSIPDDLDQTVRIKMFKEKWLEIIRQLAKEWDVDCYAEQCLKGSGCEIPPDPFIDMSSYFVGQPKDVYDRLIERIQKGEHRLNPKDPEFKSGKIVKKVALVEYDQSLPMAFDDEAEAQIKAYREKERPLVESSIVKITINYKTREAQIDHIK